MRPSLCLLLLVAGAARAGDGDVDFGGHTKLRAEGQSFPANSLIRELAGSRSIDTEGDLRLNLSGGQGDWSLDAAWQLRLEEQGGSLEVGKQADLVVLSDKLFEMDSYAIHTARVMFTMMDGRVFHNDLSEAGQ